MSWRFAYESKQRVQGYFSRASKQKGRKIVMIINKRQIDCHESKKRQEDCHESKQKAGRFCKDLKKGQAITQECKQRPQDFL